MTRIATVLLVVAIASAIGLDAVQPAKPADPPVEAVSGGSGVLSCPILRASTGSGRLAVATRAASRVRVTFIPRKGKEVHSSFTMPESSARAVAIPKKVLGPAAAIIRYSGGPVTASHAIALPTARTGISDVYAAGDGAGACIRASSSRIAATHLRTYRASSILTVFNPGSGDAAITISLHADGRRLSPVSLSSNLVVRPRRWRSFNLNDHVFDVKDLTAVVTASGGRVVAEALLRSRSGVGIIGAMPASRSLVAASGRSGKGASFNVALVGEEDAGLDPRLISATEQGRASRLPASIAPGDGARIAIPNRNAAGPVSYAVDLTIGSPIVAATAWQRVRRAATEEALVEGAAPKRDWIAVVPPRTGATVKAIVVNAGARLAALTVKRNGTTGERIDLEPGRLLSLTLGRGRKVFSVDISSSEPVALSVEAYGPAGRSSVWTSGFAGTPIAPGEQVAVRHVPRIGVPAVEPEDRT